LPRGSEIYTEREANEEACGGTDEHTECEPSQCALLKLEPPSHQVKRCKEERRIDKETHVSRDELV
jgi:hypothetical protein